MTKKSDKVDGKMDIPAAEDFAEALATPGDTMPDEDEVMDAADAVVDDGVNIQQLRIELSDGRMLDFYGNYQMAPEDVMYISDQTHELEIVQLLFSQPNLDEGVPTPEKGDA